MNDALVIAIFTLVVTVALDIFLFVTQKFPPISKSNSVGATIFTALYIIQLSPSAVISSDLLQKLPAAVAIVLLIILLGLSLWPSLYYLFYVINGGKNLSQSKNEKSFFHPYLCMAAVVVETIFFTFSAIPAIWFYGDTYSVLSLVWNNTWDNWHTVGYVWLVEILDRIYPAPFSVVIFQSIIWVLLNFYIIDFLKRSFPRAVSYYTVIMCGLFTPALYLENMGKDTVFAIGTLALTAVTFKIVKTMKANFLDVLIWALLPLFAVLCRHGGFVPIFICNLMLLIYVIVKKNKDLIIKCISVIGVHLLAYIIVNVILVSCLDVIPNPACVKYGTPMAAIGAAVSEGVTFSEEDTATLQKLMPLDEWANCYNPYWADDISRPWGDLGDRFFTLQTLVDNDNFGSDLIKINARLFLSHPIIYARSIFKMNSILWEFGQPSKVDSMTVCNVPQGAEITYTFLFKFTHNITILWDKNPITCALASRGGASTFVLLLALYIFITSKSSRKYLICLTPIVLIMLLLSITIPAQDPRYVLPSIECAVFFLAIMLTGGFVDKGLLDDAKDTMKEKIDISKEAQHE